MNIYWKNPPINMDFTTAGNWAQSEVPGAGDIAELTFSGGTAIVSAAAAVTVLGVNIGSGATLHLAGNFTATEGTPIGANRGTVEVDASFIAGGTLNNPGTLTISNGGQLRVAGGLDLTVKGSGTIGLALAGGISIEAGLSLTNVDNHIVGGGTILGSDTLINQKNGVISTTSAGPLTIDVTTKNQALIESTVDVSDLQIASKVDNSSGGTVRAVGDSQVFLTDGADIIGGTLDAHGVGGQFTTNGDVTIDGSSAVVPTNKMITISGRIDVEGTLHLQGAINNSGSIGLSGPSTRLVVQAAGTNNTTTLKGFGFISPDGNVIGAGSPVTLDNVNNTILSEVSGAIGGAGLKLKNEVGGTINANNRTLVIDTGANTVSNAGLMEVSADGTLVIASNLSNTGKLEANGGTIYATGTVTGGTAIITDLGSPGVVEFGAASTTATKFAVGTTGQLIVADSAQYTGVISGFGSNTTQSIDLADFNFTGAHATSFSLGVLTLKNTAGQVVHLHFSGAHTLASFHLSDDGNFNGTDDGTKIVDPPAAMKPQTPINNLASLFGQFMASWTNPSAGLTSQLFSALATEVQTAISLPHPHS